MKNYIMSIVGAVLICIFSEMVLPDKWNKYLNIITGLIIIGAICTPLSYAFDFSIWQQINENQDFSVIAKDYSVNLVKNELEKNIKNDLEERILTEFKKETSVKVSVLTDDDNKITGIEKIILSGNIDENIISRVNEIYAPKEIVINGY